MSSNYTKSLATTTLLGITLQVGHLFSKFSFAYKQKKVSHNC